jgi:hypothetical protein
VQDVTIFGQALHVVVPSGYAAESLGRDLTRSGVEVKGIRPIEPSLEDVFVTLTKINVAHDEEMRRNRQLSIGSDREEILNAR